MTLEKFKKTINLKNNEIIEFFVKLSYYIFLELNNQSNIYPRYNNNCDTSDLDKYLNQIKEIPTKQILTEAFENAQYDEFGFTKTTADIDYAAEFIKRLKQR